MSKTKQLSDMADSQLLKLVRKDNNSDAFLEICNRHEKLFYDVCSKYSKKSQYIIYDEIIKDKFFVIGEAIRTYKQGRKAKLSTWIGHYTRFYCLKRITYMSKNNLDTGLEPSQLDIINSKLNKFDEVKNNDFKEHVLSILNSFNDKRISQIFNYRYFGEKKETWTNISKRLKISAMHTINLHDKGCKLLKHQINNK